MSFGWRFADDILEWQMRFDTREEALAAAKAYADESGLAHRKPPIETGEISDKEILLSDLVDATGTMSLAVSEYDPMLSETVPWEPEITDKANEEYKDFLDRWGSKYGLHPNVLPIMNVQLHQWED